MINAYDDMTRNNKYYLPLKDGIYSLEDKKLHKYDKLPNGHFTHKIDSNFPKCKRILTRT